jgi:hypothetical protein
MRSARDSGCGGGRRGARSSQTASSIAAHATGPCDECFGGKYGYSQQQHSRGVAHGRDEVKSSHLLFSRDKKKIGRHLLSADVWRIGDFRALPRPVHARLRFTKQIVQSVQGRSESESKHHACWCFLLASTSYRFARETRFVILT